ncbi:hypothetical protein [Hippea alviniae]|uniref:hypothetical protein n=1 Tax=Hippea alviniae TaxID=1279027 RepID=UPI0003B745E5|nr:hypothetical protein [Hippea alviniae]
MKKLCAVFVFLFVFILNSYASNLSVVVVAPFGGSLSSFSEELYNGLSLSLPSFVNLVKIDSNSDFLSELKKINPVAIVGPFSKSNVDKLLGKYCNKPVLVILPLAKDDDNCSNVAYYGYNPTLASKQLAEYVCNIDSGSIGVLYSFDKVDTVDKDAFVDTLLKCGKSVFVSSGIPSLYEVMDSFLRELFGIVKVKKISGLTKGKVFEHSLNVDTLVVFAPQKMFVHLVSLLDYYDVHPLRILSVNLQSKKSLFDLSIAVRKSLRFITPYYMCQSNSLAEKFLNDYRETFFKDPTFISAVGYDIGKLLKDYYFNNKSITDAKDINLLIGHLLFFDDTAKAVIEYRMVGYRELNRCRQEILDR